MSQCSSLPLPLPSVPAASASVVESVLLFTDGKANIGIKDQATLVRATSSLLGQIGRQACVFTLGFGSEHDADLLHAVADAGNGLFYYIDNADSIPESFCDCLGGLLSVAAQVKRREGGREMLPYTIKPSSSSFRMFG